MALSTRRAYLYALSLLSVSFLLRICQAFAVTGVSAGVNPDTGERPFRLNLKDFQSSGPPFDLYIQALSRFQAEDQSELLSWYEVAGIHGLPYRAWDGVEGSYQTGYCSHGANTFPTWHRPYVALFEQIVWNYAQDIASSYPDDTRDTYVAAATTLRVPYWDWASDPLMPDALVTPQITINTPSGQQQIDNPLYAYKFHPLPLGTDIPTDNPLANYTSTVRSPGPDGQSRMDNVQQLMTSNAAWLRSNTYQLLSTETNYTVFSNEVLTDRGQNYNNLESIHDAVHALTGDGGDMTYFDMAAFDPIFMLHHCAVDRIFAIWQVLNPDSYVEPMADSYGTFVLEAGTVETVDTPLYPFHASDDANDFWTSASVRSIATFGYSYPEIVDWGVDQQTLQNNVRAAVNNLYNPPANTNSNTTKRSLLPPPPQMSDHIQDLAAAAVTGALSSEDFFDLGVNNLARQWAINIRVNKHALSGQLFQIHFFYGPPPPSLDPSQYGHASNLIGTYRTFTSPGRSSSSQRTLSYGQISLSPVMATALAHGFVPPNLAPDAVVPQLAQNLNWRVTDFRGRELDPQELVDRGDLRIGVVSRDVMPLEVGQEHLFPRYGGWMEHVEATAGKVGGVDFGL
ncbi:hypothetical protein VTN77DRAFT_483 [Rasamsonia byssochlamydoides]|uniref:uncharacterized protein n=1 Tax=Rasamsonia byssochlamydoides TaxID=89139 RepID=UPI00374459F0